MIRVHLVGGGTMPATVGVLASMDGRGSCTPALIGAPVPFGTQPAKMSCAQARDTLQRFARQGESTHSGHGGLLWLVLWFCQLNKIPYVLVAVPGYGYMVRAQRQM